MPAAWPSTLPQKVLAEGYAEKLRPAVIRTAMDVGIAKTRRRYTATITDITVRLRLTPAQASTLDTFFNVTLAAGSLPFTWTHPRTGAAVTLRFLEPPQVAPEARGLAWEVTLSLEILP